MDGFNLNLYPADSLLVLRKDSHYGNEDFKLFFTKGTICTHRYANWSEHDYNIVGVKIDITPYISVYPQFKDDVLELYNEQTYDILYSKILKVSIK